MPAISFNAAAYVLDDPPAMGRTERIAQLAELEPVELQPADGEG